MAHPTCEHKISDVKNPKMTFIHLLAHCAVKDKKKPTLRPESTPPRAAVLSPVKPGAPQVFLLSLAKLELYVDGLPLGVWPTLCL